MKSLCRLCVLCVSVLNCFPQTWKLPPGEVIRGAALAADQRTLFTWGSRLLAWSIPTGSIKVLRGDGPAFGEGGCLVDGGVVVQEGSSLGKMVWFRSPGWSRRELESETEFHDCLAVTLFGRRGVLMVHRHGQVRFYELPGGAMSEIYSFYTPSNQTGLLLTDVDGDGLPDILCGNYWIRSPERYELPWRLFAINTYSEIAESAMLRLTLEHGLVVSQGHLPTGKVTRFEKPPDPKRQWIERRLDDGLNLQFPHGLAALPSGGIVVGENNGAASRVILISSSGRRIINSGMPVHTIFSIGENLLLVGPDAIRYLRRY